jgi:hypothetical protein
MTPSLTEAPSEKHAKHQVSVKPDFWVLAYGEVVKVVQNDLNTFLTQSHLL